MASKRSCCTTSHGRIWNTTSGRECRNPSGININYTLAKEDGSGIALVSHPIDRNAIL